MKLNDVYTKPLKDVVEELNLTDMKVHTDDDGDENKALYEWDDLDGPRPTMDEYEKQEKEARE